MRTNRMNILTLNKPTSLSKVYDSIPRPSGAVPKNGLPRWNDMPLWNKIPMVPGMKKAVVLSRDKVGVKLWRHFRCLNFTVHDPLMVETRYDYEALHDPHLYPYFNRPHIKELMRRMGFISADGDALCGIKQFNTYRLYLDQLYRACIKKNLQIKDIEMKENYKIRLAEANAERDLQKVKAKNLRLKKTAHYRAILLQQKLDKEKKCAERRKLFVERTQRLEERRKMDLELTKERINHQNELTASKRAAADFLDKLKRMAAMRLLMDEERKLTENLARIDRESRKNKELKDDHLWQTKYAHQLFKLSKEKWLLQKYLADEEMLLNIRKKMMEDEWIRMDELLKEIKKRGLREHEGKKMADNILNAIATVMEEKKESEIEVEEKDWVMERVVQPTVAEFKSKSEGKDILTVLMGTRDKFDTMTNLPEEAAHPIENVLNFVIIEFVRLEVSKSLKQIIERGIQQYRNKIQKRKTNEERKSLLKSTTRQSEGSRSSSASDKLRSMERLSSYERRSDAKFTRSVSFGTVNTIGVMVNAPGAPPLQSTKDRPPTPVPSITLLVKEVFKEPTISMSEEQDAGQEKKKLVKALQLLAKYIMKLVIQRIDDMDNKLYSTRPHQAGVDLKKYEVINKLAHKVLADEDHVTDIEDVQIIVEFLMKEIIKGYQKEDKLKQEQKMK